MPTYKATGPSTYSLRSQLGGLLPCVATAGSQICFTFSGGGFCVRLPENTQIISNLRQVFHRSRESKIFIYKRGKRSKTFEIQVVGLTRLQYLTVDAGIEQARGKLVTYTDPYGEKFVGTIAAFTAIEGSIQHGYDFNMTFEAQ